MGGQEEERWLWDVFYRDNRKGEGQVQGGVEAGAMPSSSGSENKEVQFFSLLDPGPLRTVTRCRDTLCWSLPHLP